MLIRRRRKPSFKQSRNGNQNDCVQPTRPPAVFFVRAVTLWESP